MASGKCRETTKSASLVNVIGNLINLVTSWKFCQNTIHKSIFVWRTSKLLFKHLNMSDYLWWFKEVNDRREFIGDANERHSSQRIETEFCESCLMHSRLSCFDITDKILPSHKRLLNQGLVSFFDCEIPTQERTKQISPESIQVQIEWNTDGHTIASLEISNQPFLKRVFSIHCISNHNLMLQFVEQLSVHVEISLNFHRGRLCILVVTLFIHPYLSFSSWDIPRSRSDSR
jgi:hypothetical protein